MQWYRTEDYFQSLLVFVCRSYEVQNRKHTRCVFCLKAVCNEKDAAQPNEVHPKIRRKKTLTSSYDFYPLCKKSTRKTQLTRNGKNFQGGNVSIKRAKNNEGERERVRGRVVMAIRARKWKKKQKRKTITISDNMYAVHLNASKLLVCQAFRS